MSSPRPTVNPEDVARADGVLRAWIDANGRGAEQQPTGYPLLRGFLIGAFADCRHDSYADALLDYRAASTDPVQTLAGERLGG